MKSAPSASSSVLFPFVGDSVGGSHISALALVRELPKLGFRPLVALHLPGGPLAAHLDRQGMPYTVLPAGAVVTGGGIAAEALRMVRSAFILRSGQQGGIGIVHTNDLRMHMTWGLASRVMGVAHVWHQRTAANSRRLEYYSRLSSRILTISEYCRTAFPAAMGRRAIVVDEPFEMPLDPAVDRAECRASLEKELGVTPNSLIVGFVGNMAAQKRPDIFVELANSFVDAAGAPLIFVMIGDDRGFAQGNSSVTALIEAGRLRILGPRFPVLRDMAGFDILIAPGVREGLGRTVVEAMSVGTLVVAANDGGHREVIVDGQTGFLAEPDNPASFVDKLNRLLAIRPAWTEIAQAAETAVLTRFAASRHAVRITDIYKDLAPRDRH